MNAWNLFTKQTDKASSIARQIVFALAAVSWGSLYDKGSIQTRSTIFIICMILVVLYFIVDVLQYYLSARKLRKLEYNYMAAKGAQNKYIIGKVNKKYVSKRIEIEHFSYRLFTMKMLIIPAIAFLIFCQYLLLLLK